MAKLYFSHDIDARNSAELMKVRMRMGPEGYAIYFMMLEKLAEAGDHKLECDYQCLAFDLRTDEDKIRKVVEDYGLFKIESGAFYSSGLDKRLNTAKSVSEKRRQASMTRWCNTNEMQNECKTDASALQTSSKTDASALQNECNKKENINLKINNNIINNNPPQRSACVREEGFAEEEEKIISEDIFLRFDRAMSEVYPKKGVISATDDNRLRRYLTCETSKVSTVIGIIKSYLVDHDDIVGLRQMMERTESAGNIRCISFDEWKILTSLGTLSKSDQKKIRDLVRKTPEGMSTLAEAMKEIESSKGKIKMPSRYIISKLTGEK